MKNIFTLAFLSFSFISFSQNYELFNANSKKLFTTSPTAGLTSGIAFDSVIFAGDFTIYENYTGLDSLSMWSDSCQFWGGNSCIQQNRPLWFGSHIIRDFMNTYTFYTEYNGMLYLNFFMQPGDSSMFYQDSIQEFYIVCEGTDTATILALPDSAKYYRIEHYDRSGNIFDSPLNNAQIMIGKEMGLASFFRVDSFPTIEQPLTLAGNLSPAAGLINLTEDMIYDYDIGDEIEFYEYYYQMDGPPWNNFSKYVKQIIIDRNEMDDLIYYYADQTTFYPDSGIINEEIVILTISKNRIYGEIPFDKIDQEHDLQITHLYNADYCGLNLSTYRTEPQYKTYCSSDNCWGDFDIPGPPPLEDWVYVCGLGLYYYQSDLVYPPPVGYSRLHKIVYFKKGEIECGEDMITGIAETNPELEDFSIYPNPARNYFNFRTGNIAADQLTISNIHGQIIKKVQIRATSQTIDISDLEPGLYFVKELDSSNGRIIKMMKIK